MDVHLQSVQNSDNILVLDKMKCYTEHEIDYSCTEDNNGNEKDILNEKQPSAIDTRADMNIYEEELKCNKNLNVREIQETSPFKQAVKGFVLNKLSKKVGTSHILSGITEKIVKKLEDNKDNQLTLVPNSESELNLSSLKFKESSSEVLSSSLSCELKSVVANDLALSDVLNIENAIECFEEPKLSTGNEDCGVKMRLKPDCRSSSISLPNSPAHRFMKRASSVSSSLEREEIAKKFLSIIDSSTLHEDKSLNESSIIDESNENEIESHEIKRDNALPDERDLNSTSSYKSNTYSKEGEDHIPPSKNSFTKFLYACLVGIKNAFSSLSLSNLFLLAFVISHNVDIFSPYLIIFDALVIIYLCYCYSCARMQEPVQYKAMNFLFADTQLEKTSIYVQKANKNMKGLVKILKGDYNPEATRNHPTDLINIVIENSCLKLSLFKKNSKEEDIVPEYFATYNLIGANISIVPKNVSKRRIWKKYYPICIAFPATTESNSSDNFDSDLESTYLHISTPENNSSDNLTQKAIYLFAMTDREKESLFWILERNTKVEEKIIKSANHSHSESSKFSSVSYSALLESAIDDDINLQVGKPDEDDSTDDSNVTLDFEVYMRSLFENYERMNKFTSRSRSFEDIPSSRDSYSKIDESFSKDDSFLTNSSKEYSVDWLNLVLGRVFYDFLTQQKWSDYVKARIQKKLDKIEMPSFIESLEVSEVYLGTSLPQVYTVSSPITDVNGLWLDFDFNYCGSFQMTLTTKLNIIKDKNLPISETEEKSETKQNIMVPLSESSDDENNEAKSGSGRKKKFLNGIEKLLSHKRFQTVAQSRFVKKYVGDLSNMPLALTVELNTLHGMLTVNIPPAPTDRIWYGFRKDPVLSLNAYPKVGTHEINLSAIVKTIEKKLIQEFKKALVMPNMDDLIIPVMYTPVYNY